MTRKKNKFFTFVFSTMFGAGQMYMGFMKQGISIMTLTVFIIALGSWTGIGTIFLILPVLWFYSFFDSINKMSMPNREFESLEDNYIFLPKQEGVQLKSLITKYENAIAITLILLGGIVLFENILDFIADWASNMNYDVLENFIYTLRWNGSKVLFSIIIILIGVKMILGKKKELDREEPELFGDKTEFHDSEIKKDFYINPFIESENAADLEKTITGSIEQVSNVLPIDTADNSNQDRNNH
ncbi:hypothetical protein [Anaerocolumna sp. MB42-C2]|uniref:hypothetical protein n=1 Tax=Anaerocolumna sp. MB42-C2 TaxID=3070997 RepID=UPI0027E16D97|nr:hypothetical protein [Anaerocolumna sp. MB42-C2]WMJ87814.1 hypothetical protein RBU59_27925 [Anaerocolumna sp. MB42-C2]